MVDYGKNLESMLNKRATSLSERLNELDQYRATNTAEKAFADRPARLNPMEILDTLVNRNATRTGIEDEMTNVYSNLYNLSKTNADTTTPSPSDLLKGALEGYEWKDGKWVSSSGTIQLKGQAAVREVQKQGGSALLNIAKTLTERESLAETILGFGGVREYKTQANLEEVMNKDDYAKFKAGSDLLQDINTVQTYFPKGTDTAMNIFGSGNLTGPITGRKGPLRNTNQVTIQALISDLATKKVKELSGVAVSPQEFERLKPLLPGATDQENEVADKLDALQRRVAMNLEAKEMAARTGVDAASYWNKNKDALLLKYGFTNEVGGGGVETNVGIDEAALNTAIQNIRENTLGGQ